MTTSRQARHSQFQLGQGSFSCNNCGRKTRDTGDNGQCKLCPECFELAGIENHLQDSGSLDNEAGAAREYLNRLGSHIGTERAEGLHPDIVTALAAVEEAPADDLLPTMEERIEAIKEAEGWTEYSVAVSGNENGTEVDELILVEAPAARFARRIARAELKAAGRNTDNMVFNARRA